MRLQDDPDPSHETTRFLTMVRVSDQADTRQGEWRRPSHVFFMATFHERNDPE